MSAHNPCTCGARDLPVAERPWRVTAYKCNNSAFNGYHRTASDYSAIQCDGKTATGGNCNGYWRTKASYVEELIAAGKGKDAR